MKEFTPHVKNRILGIGYILIVTDQGSEGTKYLIQCTLNAQHHSIAVGSHGCAGRWIKSKWTSIATNNTIKHHLHKETDYYKVFNTFEDLIDEYPFLYDQYFITQPPCDTTPGDYEYRELTHKEGYMRDGWTAEKYEQFFKSSKIANMICPGKNSFGLRDV